LSPASVRSVALVDEQAAKLAPAARADTTRRDQRRETDGTTPGV
jgi:hypothetical protein